MLVGAVLVGAVLVGAVLVDVLVGAVLVGAVLVDAVLVGASEKVNVHEPVELARLVAWNAQWAAAIDPLYPR